MSTFDRARAIAGRARDLIREALTDNERDYTSGSQRKALVLLAIPMMLEMSMEAVFAVVDIFFVTRLGADAVAVVGVTEAMLTILYAIAIGLSTAVTALVARRIGENNPSAAATVVGQSIWIAATLTLLLGVGGVLSARALLGFMGLSSDAIAGGWTYTAIMLGGSASILYLFLLNAAFRGAGDATIALRSLWLANGVNLILDPCLIFGLGPFPELGIAGAAIATTIGRSLGIVYQLYYLLGVKGRLRLRLANLAVVPGVMLNLIRVSAGGIGQFLVATSSWIIMIRILASFGSSAVAGFTLALRLIEFAFLPAWGLGNAAATLVGQNLGAAKPRRAEQSAWLALRVNVGFLTLVAVLFVLAPQPLVALFDAPPAVADMAILCMRIVGLGYPLYAVGIVMTQSLNGAGDTYTPTLLNFVCFWAVQIPLAWWLTTTTVGASGIAWAILVGESLLGVLSVWVFRRGRWKCVDV